ncbi:hypothetical protein [Rhodospirillum sp. A1_3_36]|uniref:hypothetical protein n=1 Tax=Rhodospirillum sp. A1_3_36 TaxID=3391666 RepID=UPI0039A6F654
MTSSLKHTWQNEPIDPRIKPLVDAMNATGRIQTIASCEGHWNRYSTPYVYFRCTQETATEICTDLTALQIAQGLTYYWGIIGLFDEKSKLCFRLQAGELEPPLGLVRSFWHFLFKRARIDADLQVLASLFSGGLKNFKGSIIRSGLPEVDHRANDEPALAAGVWERMNRTYYVSKLRTLKTCLGHHGVRLVSRADKPSPYPIDDCLFRILAQDMYSQQLLYLRPSMPEEERRDLMEEAWNDGEPQAFFDEFLRCLADLSIFPEFYPVQHAPDEEVNP